MKIAYNPKDAVVVTATTAANNDILFDLNARKVWAKGLRMGADWEDISNKPSSLKNPEAIKFRDINGAEVSYDGSIAKDLMAGTYIAKLPYGFSSFTSEPTWGNVIGSSIASWNDESGGSIDFRKDNPSSGKMSIKVNGRVYVNGGFNPVLSAEFNNGYWGIRTPDGGDNWIRTPNAGLLPYTYGNAGSGHSSLGTNSQYFSTAYIDQVYGDLRGNADNADTVDGEHASSFVRAGSYEQDNLNNLDTYSFIRSVNSNTSSTSPKGMTGWYNVIQAVHRNGLEDGPEYMGQIALGMTTNTNKMFFRTKYEGSWYAWNEVATTDTALLRYSRNNVNINSSNCSPIPPSLLEWTIGYPRLYDPEFNDGYNNVYVYNNAGNGAVTVTRVYDTNVGNSSSYIMKVVSAAGAVPNYGGWNVATQTELGKVYTCLFRASIPSGVEIEFNTNSIGNGGQWSWLTDNMGTSKWTWYAVQVYCGSEGSTTFFFSAKSPCTWYLSYVNVIENNRASYAGLRSVYSDYLKQNASLVFGRNELQYFNQYTNVTTGADKNANPKADWHYILRMNHANERGYFVDLAIPFNDNRIQFRRITGGYDNGWRRIITEEPNHNVILCDSSAEGSVTIGPIPNNIGKNKLYVNGSSTFTGLVTNIGGILPASYDVNKSNTSCYVWGDAVSTGVTAITDALDPKYVTVVYSQSNGDSWIDSHLKPEEKFNLYANNGAYKTVYLGGNRTADSSEPNSLAQVQKNQLMVTFEIPNNMYSQLCWASVDISNGVNTVCTVEILDKNSTIKYTFTKTMYGWSMVNYINFWGINFPVVQIGQDSARFIRFKFKHDKNNTDNRNALIYKIRLFSFTKFYLDSDDFRSIAAFTGNLYKYDKDLNITFPNAIYCNTLNIGGNINCLADTISIKSKDDKEIIYYDSNVISFLERTYFGQRLCIATTTERMGINNITTDDTSALISLIIQNPFTFTFKQAYDGQLLFLKLQNGYSNTRIYCATQDCSVVKAMAFETHIARNQTKEIFGDGKARIFIYQAIFARWCEFYCG